MPTTGWLTPRCSIFAISRGSATSDDDAGDHRRDHGEVEPVGAVVPAGARGGRAGLPVGEGS
jgi:hypothetical protein